MTARNSVFPSYLDLSMVAACKDNAATSAGLTYGSSADDYNDYDRFGHIAATLWKTDDTVLVHQSTTNPTRS